MIIGRFTNTLAANGGTTLDSNSDRLRLLEQRQFWARVTIIGVLAGNAALAATYAGIDSALFEDHYFTAYNTYLSEMVALVLIVPIVASWIAVGMWIHRAHTNIHAAQLGGLEFTPGWAVGWFFIPIASLWKPFQAMRELWNASVGSGNALDEPANSLLWVWWLAWIFGNFSALGTEDATFGYILLAMDCLSAAALWIIITTITREQETIGYGEVFA